MPMMKNLDAAILGTNGKPMKMNEGDIKDLTLRVTAMEALLTQYPFQMFPDEIPNGIESCKRYDIYKRLNDGGDVDLDKAEIDKIKNLVGKRFPPYVVGVFNEMIDKDGVKKNAAVSK